MTHDDDDDDDEQVYECTIDQELAGPRDAAA